MMQIWGPQRSSDDVVMVDACVFPEWVERLRKYKQKGVNEMFNLRISQISGYAPVKFVQEPYTVKSAQAGKNDAPQTTQL